MKKICVLLSVLLFSALFGSFQALAKEPSLLENIQLDSSSSHEDRITFYLTGNYVPTMFTIMDEKPRVVIDFPDTAPGSQVSNTINVRATYVDKIRVGMHKEPKQKTRVVLDLFSAIKLDIKKEFDEQAKTFTITIAKRDVNQPLTSEKKSPSAKKKTVTAKNKKAAEPKKKSEPVKKTKQAASKAVEPVLSPEPDPVPEPDIAATAGDEPPLLSSVKFDKSSNRGEMVLFKLNDFYPPIVFGIEEDVPRVVCDFMDTKVIKAVAKFIECNGKFIKSVRIGTHMNPDKVRVVIDLAPNHNYDLQQVFFKEDNLFVIIVNTVDKSKST